MNIGIYKITSPSNRIYIGQSRDIEQRIKKYNYPSIQKLHPRLGNSIIKYGIENHIFEILEVCSIDNLNERERYWQDYYDVLGPSGLNCKLTETTELPQKSIKRKCEKISLLKKGKKLSEEHKIKLRKKKKKGREVVNTQTGEIFNNITDAAQSLNLKYLQLANMLWGRTKNKTFMKYYKIKNI